MYYDNIKHHFFLIFNLTNIHSMSKTVFLYVKKTFDKYFPVDLSHQREGKLICVGNKITDNVLSFYRKEDEILKCHIVKVTHIINDWVAIYLFILSNFQSSYKEIEHFLKNSIMSSGFFSSSLQIVGVSFRVCQRFIKTDKRFLLPLEVTSKINWQINQMYWTISDACNNSFHVEDRWQDFNLKLMDKQIFWCTWQFHTILFW